MFHDRPGVARVTVRRPLWRLYDGVQRERERACNSSERLYRAVHGGQKRRRRRLRGRRCRPRRRCRRHCCGRARERHAVAGGGVEQDDDRQAQGSSGVRLGGHERDFGPVRACMY